MPYKVMGRSVYVKRNNKWVLLKRHPSKNKAEQHARALRKNVPHYGRRKKK